jgi:hypothetical protein
VLINKIIIMAELKPYISDVLIRLVKKYVNNLADKIQEIYEIYDDIGDNMYYNETYRLNPSWDTPEIEFFILTKNHFIKLLDMDGRFCTIHKMKKNKNKQKYIKILNESVDISSGKFDRKYRRTFCTSKLVENNYKLCDILKEILNNEYVEAYNIKIIRCCSPKNKKEYENICIFEDGEVIKIEDCFEDEVDVLCYKSRWNDIFVEINIFNI